MSQCLAINRMTLSCFLLRRIDITLGIIYIHPMNSVWFTVDLTLCE